MKKVVVLLLVLLMGVMFVGCSTIEATLSRKMMMKSGIYDDADYLAYQQYETSGQLDADGFYTEAVDVEEEHAPIRVTFGRNSNLKILYYTDETHSGALTQSVCYLNPGDEIYAVCELDGDAVSSLYSFSEFRVYEYNEENVRHLSDTLAMESSGNQYVLHIPVDFTGTEIAIEPVGFYEERTFRIRDYYTDDDDMEYNLTGVWTVNDKEYTSDVVEINPNSPYIVSYQFDNEKYFLVSISPEDDCFYCEDDTEGIVIFNQRDAADETVDYAVELHEYISMEIVSDRERTVIVNGEDRGVLKVNEPIEISQLMYGSKVEIQTNEEWTALENIRELNYDSGKRLANGDYLYTLLVPEKGGEFEFDPEAYTYSHGTVSFQCCGEVISSKQILARGRRIYYEESSADEGYWLAGETSEHYIVVGDEAETIAALQSIHFTPKVDVTVELPQPAYGGSITYSLDGAVITDKKVATYSGAKISMVFYPWSGWITPEAYKDGFIYEVSGQENQKNDEIGDVRIDDLFSEDKDHQPELTVCVDQNLGDNAVFKLYLGDNLLIDSESNDAKELGSSRKFAVNKSVGQIGTAQPIRLTIENKAIQSGTAVRIVLAKTDTQGQSTEEIHYIDDLSRALEPIYIYEPGTNATATDWYESIDIQISVVDILTYTSPEASAHSQITVAETSGKSKNSENRMLSDGDLIEPTSKVVVTIVPESGYYVTGKNVSAGCYSGTMKYSEFLKEIGEILEEHPIEQYYSIVLDSSDAYADYTYKLDGTEVSGTIYAREGQKLELTYKITDSEYALQQSGGVFSFLKGNSSAYQVKKTITVSSLLDGMTVTKADFGIETE